MFTWHIIYYFIRWKYSSFVKQGKVVVRMNLDDHHGLLMDIFRDSKSSNVHRIGRIRWRQSGRKEPRTAATSWWGQSPTDFKAVKARRFIGPDQVHQTGTIEGLSLFVYTRVW